MALRNPWVPRAGLKNDKETLCRTSARNVRFDGGNRLRQKSVTHSSRVVHAQIRLFFTYIRSHSVSAHQVGAGSERSFEH